MAEKKDTKDTEAKPATKKAPAKKPAAKKTAAKPAAKKPAATTASETKAKPSTTKAKSGGTTKAKGSTGAKATAASKKLADAKAPERPIVKARARYVRIAPRKARLIADQVRGLPLEEAQTLLRFSPRGVAQDIAKVIASAAANAENNHDLIADDLMVKDIHVDEGPTLRRYRPRALGRATPINKRTCHINVALTPED